MTECIGEHPLSVHINNYLEQFIIFFPLFLHDITLTKLTL